MALLERLAAVKNDKGRLLPTLALSAVILLAAWMGSVDGGYFARHWALAALVLIVLMLAIAVAGVAYDPRHRWTIAAFALFGTYTLWTFASLLWSSNLGAAWLGAGQTLFYLITFGIALILVMMNASRRWVMAASVFGPAVVAAFTLVGLNSNLDYFFREGLLIGTVGYHNGEAAFLLISFWVAIYLGGSRRVNPLLRAGILAAAVLNVDVALLAQSRGAMVAMAASLPVFFLLSGQRLRGLLAFIPVAAAVALAFPGLNGVYLAFIEGTDPVAAVNDAMPTVWSGIAGAGFYGLIWGLIDLRWRPPRLAARLAGAVALASVAVGLVVGASLFINQFGNPAALAEQKWAAFKNNDTAGREQSRFLSASGSGRYTLWQVAREDFARQPILGVGTNGYEATFYQLREREAGAVRQPHMLPLEVLSERGIVGGVLFFGFLATCWMGGLWKRFTDLNSEGKAQVGALGAAVAYWFVQSSAEWLWQISAVTLPAMVYLAMLVAPWRKTEIVRLRWPLRTASVGVALLALVVVTPLYAADYYLTRSYASANPEVALQAVERAQNFNPLDSRLYEREAEMAVEAGEWGRAERAYKRAISLNPEHYAPYMLLGSFYEQRGQLQQSLTYYQKALERNPLDEELGRDIGRLQDIMASPDDGEGLPT